MKEIGCFICNYNKRNYVLDCVDSLLSQTQKNLDIYVVDNASTDDSVEALVKKFGGRIEVLVNVKNLGGSGGFNTGLRKALEKQYRYVVLIDNDVVVAPDAIENMYRYMESHQDVGILGAKILQMQHPTIIQDLGGHIDEEYNMRGNYYGQKDENLPEEIECDYISTCTAMARVEAVGRFGLMPEDNFIYWDDVEWSRKCQLAGYKTVAIGSAKVWHNHSIINMTSSFTIYYMTRNRLHFFAKYGEMADREHFAQVLLSEIYTKICGYYGKGMTDAAATVMSGFLDFLYDIRGKADDWKIAPIKMHPSPFQKAAAGKEQIVISGDRDMNEQDFLTTLCAVIANLQSVEGGGPRKRKVLLKEGWDIGQFRKRLNACLESGADCDLQTEPETDENRTEGDLHLVLCRHISEAKESILPKVYTDRYCNSITSEDEYLFFKSFQANQKLFMAMYHEAFWHRMEILQMRQKKEE